ncbi:MAG: response regulator transcription factor [Proteobacteria bacterium]|nr:response regulator transcription factor [Pseudomonadota bacterium]
MGVNILLVDDHAIVRVGFRALLEQQRWCGDITEAANGELGYLMFRDAKPHVVVMDLSMPKMSGVTAIQRIRARGRSHPRGQRARRRRIRHAGHESGSGRLCVESFGAGRTRRRGACSGGGEDLHQQQYCPAHRHRVTARPGKSLRTTLGA